MGYLYLIENSSQPTTAAPVKQPSGTAIRTMMQLVPAATLGIKIKAWGVSGDASAAGAPGQIELMESSALATGLSTAYAAGDIMPYDPNAPANTAGTTGVPFNLGTSLSGFATGAVTEGTAANVREFDIEQLAPTNQYENWWPLGLEPMLKPGNGLRIRVTFAVTVNLYCWVLVEV